MIATGQNRWRLPAYLKKPKLLPTSVRRYLASRREEAEVTMYYKPETPETVVAHPLEL